MIFFSHFPVFPSSLSWMFCTPLIPWQISLPQVQVGVYCPSCLGSTYILPLSTLTLWCEGTFHATPLTNGGFLNPTWVFIQKEFRVYHSLQLSIRHSSLFSTFMGHLGPLHLPSALQGQKCGITREINITKIHLSITVKIHNDVSCYSTKRCRCS